MHDNNCVDNFDCIDNDNVRTHWTRIKINSKEVSCKCEDGKKLKQDGPYL